MEDREIFILLAVALAVAQFLYRFWDKKDTAILLKAFSESVKSFDPHIERTKQTLTLVKELNHMHDQRDSDGRPMWYTPKENLDGQRELIKLSALVAETQKQMLALMARMDVKIDDHKITCVRQYSDLDKKVGVYGFVNGQRS